MKVIFLAWRDPVDRRWFPIGRLTQENNHYKFQYTNGALEASLDAKFVPLAGFDSFGLAYTCPTLFPFFYNRLIPIHRNDAQKYLQWLDFSEVPEPLALLARSGGLRATDAFQVFECPTPTANNEYKVTFFVHGIGHIEQADKLLDSIRVGDELLLVQEPTNPADQLALLVMRDNTKVGYCPRFYNEDINALLKRGEQPRAFVKRINPTSVPFSYRLLCEVECKWPADFKACSSKQFQPYEPPRNSLEPFNPSILAPKKVIATTELEGIDT